MKDIEDYLEETASLVEKEVRNFDYIGEDDLLYCGRCNTRKEHRLTFGGWTRTVGVLCECQKKRLAEEEEQRRRKEQMMLIRQRKSTCIHDRALLECTFERDDGSLPQLKSARRYVETWKERKQNNDGLLLWGNVGTGKTFYAACIANALIEEGVSVLMTNFSKILNQITGMYAGERNEFIAAMMRYSLLIIDDFGIERNTEYALEQIYNVIDERYKSRLPLIVTTNLPLSDLQNPKDQAHQRIYDRLLAMCVPVKFLGDSHRLRDRERIFKSCRALFEDDQIKKTKIERRK